MIQADHLLAVTRRCELLDVARSTVYYRPTGISAEDLALMRRLDEIHLERPFYGSRRLRDELETQGDPGESQASPAPGAPDGPARPVSEAAHEPARGRTHGVSLPAEGPVHRATESGVGNRYLLHPDGARVHVSGGHPGLVLAPRPGLAGVEHLRQQLLCRGPRGCAHPLRTAGDLQYGHQGAQFTSKAFTTVLKAHAVAISMDGKGRWVDNVFVERLWRRVKDEDVYLHAYDTPAALRAGLTGYFQFYTGRRRHSSLGRRTPDVVYFGATGFGTAA